MSKIITETMIALKLVWFRVSLFFFVPFFTVVLSQTETWSGETWETTHWFLKLRILLYGILAGLTSFMAFLDQGLAKAREEVKKTAEDK